jgi:hypothetical protein
MNSLFAAILTYESAHWQAQLSWFVAALPSIIVAATPYPRVSAVLKKISWLLNLFSVLTHKDSPNTIKAPLTQSKPPVVVGQTVTTTIATTSIVGAALIFGLLTMSAPAQAQVISSGPSLSFMEIRPGFPNPVQVAAGAGYQLSFGFFQTNQLLQGTEVDLLDVGGAIYGSVVSNQAGASAGSLGMSLFVGTFNEVLAIGIGEDILSSNGGVFTTPPYGLLMFNPLRIALGSPPSVTGAPGVTGARRWATEYLGL